MNKIKVGLLFGGKSFEHQVSLLSAKNVIKEIDRSKYTLTLLGIDTEGKWALYDEKNYLENENDPVTISLSKQGQPFDFLKTLRSLDVAFPVLHGPLGEDGTIQGLFRMLDLPFVGADVLGSAIGMDKEVMKRLLKEQGIPHAPFLILHREDSVDIDQIVDTHSLPLFVKPTNGGSSIGITKVKEKGELSHAIEEAFHYDTKVIIEQAIKGREIQIGVIGNHDPVASLACEIIPKGEFHSYLSKYIDPNGAQFIYPAPIELDIYLKARKVALRTYKTLCCQGMARVDLFLKPCGEILVNEINTIPGLTKMSPFLKMWQASGIEYPELIDRLIGYAFQRKEVKVEKVLEKLECHQ